jgi:hypothetical protein
MARKKAAKKTVKRAAKKTPAKEPAVLDSPSERPIVPTWKVLGVLVLIIAFIAVLLWATQRSESFEHNGFLFERAHCPTGEFDCWQTTVVLNVGVRPILFYYNPLQVEDILVSSTAVERVLAQVPRPNASGEIIITWDDGVPGEVAVAATSIARITGERVYRIPTRGVVYGEVTCGHARPDRVVMYLMQAERSAVTVRDGCVLVGATSPSELIRVADAFAFALLGITAPA